jgi:hypothetical protein
MLLEEHDDGTVTAIMHERFHKFDGPQMEPDWFTELRGKVKEESAYGYYGTDSMKEAEGRVLTHYRLPENEEWSKLRNPAYIFSFTLSNAETVENLRRAVASL